MSFIGFKYFPNVESLKRRIISDISFTNEVKESMFARLQRRKLREQMELS
jgi:hypothetical protein